MGDRYNPLFELGAGAFGNAWVVKDNITQKKHVSKVIQIKGLSSKALDRCITEVTVLSACSHVNIVRYIEAFVNDGSLHIVMEYATGGDLWQKIDKQNGVWFPSETILDWFLQVVLALEYIHNRNILHRDLKPQNIFLTNHSIVKLGDFGIARVLNDCDDLALTRIGTPLYISPEICERKPYNSSSDMWAAGCLLYQICLLRAPFQAVNFDELTKKIVKAEYESIPRYFSPLISRMISSLLVINPSDRLTAKQLLTLEGVQEMLAVKKKDLSLKKCRSSRPRSTSLVTRRSRLKDVDKIRSNSVDRSSKKVQVPEKLTINPVAVFKEDKYVNVETEKASKRGKIPVSRDENKDYSEDNSSKEYQEKHEVDDSSEKAGSEQRLFEYNEEQRMQGKTFTIRDSFVRKLSNASPRLAQTICKQRFSLSITDPDALHSRKMSCTVEKDDGDDLCDLDNDDVFSSPCTTPASRIEGSSNPASRMTEGSTPTSRIKESSNSTSRMTESSNPTSRMTESSNPTSRMTESSNPTSRIKESSNPTSRIKESSNPTNRIKESSNPTSRFQGSSLTYTISDKVKGADGNNNNNNSNNKSKNNNNSASSDVVHDELRWMNNTILEALSVKRFNKELSRSILLDEIIQSTGPKRCDYLLRLVNVHIVENGQGIESLRHILKPCEEKYLPLIAVYLSSL